MSTARVRAASVHLAILLAARLRLAPLVGSRRFAVSAR
jgi:hypothetical protein